MKNDHNYIEIYSNYCPYNIATLFPSTCSLLQVSSIFGNFWEILLPNPVIHIIEYHFICPRGFTFLFHWTGPLLHYFWSPHCLLTKPMLLPKRLRVQSLGWVVGNALHSGFSGRDNLTGQVNLRRIDRVISRWMKTVNTRWLTKKVVLIFPAGRLPTMTDTWRRTKDRTTETTKMRILNRIFLLIWNQFLENLQKKLIFFFFAYSKSLFIIRNY